MDMKAPQESNQLTINQKPVSQFARYNTSESCRVFPLQETKYEDTSRIGLLLLNGNKQSFPQNDSSNFQEIKQSKQKERTGNENKNSRMRGAPNIVIHQNASGFTEKNEFDTDTYELPTESNQLTGSSPQQQQEELRILNGKKIRNNENKKKFQRQNNKRHSEDVQFANRQSCIMRSSRRNGLGPFISMNKQVLGRITYINMKSAQNQAEYEVKTESDDSPLPQNQGRSICISNKKLSISWKFINILVLIQTLTNKIKLLGSMYKLKKLTPIHYSYLNDSTVHLNESNKPMNIIQRQFIMFENQFLDIKLINYFKSVKVLKPEQTIVILWKILIFCVLISQLIYIPINIAFFNFKADLSGVSEVLLNRLPMTVCFVDIFVNFNLAFFSAEGVVVSDRKGIISNYIRFSFWLDLISTISLALSDFHYPDLCFLLRIFQISEIISYLDERFQLSQRFNTPFTLIKLIATIIIIAHIFGCGFYYMSFYDSNYNWVNNLQLNNPSWGTLYIKSMYFIIITMITVGFGDITPKNNAETIYVLGIALLSCFQFGYTVNVIGSLFQEKAQQQAIIKAQKYQISTYMRQRMISNSLQMLVLKNLDYIQNQQIDSPAQGLSILEKVSDKLKSSVKFDFNWRILKNQSLLNHYFSQNFLKELTKVMTEKTFIPGEFIYSRGQIQADNSLYILIKGHVDLTLHSLLEKESKKKFVIQSKNTGDMFGYFSFFTGQPRETDCECTVASHAISCTQSEFLNIAKKYPADYEKFCSIRDDIFIQQKDKQAKCTACNKFGHCLTDCPFIHFKYPKVLLKKFANTARYQSLVITRYDYSQERIREKQFKRKRIKAQTFCDLNEIRHGLIKLRLKLIKQIEIKKKKKEKASLPKKFKRKSSSDEYQNHYSSFESSDLSDYKHELQMEEQERKSKAANLKSFKSFQLEKHFFLKYPKIGFKDREIIILSSTDSDLQTDSSNEGDSSRSFSMNSLDNQIPQMSQTSIKTKSQLKLYSNDKLEEKQNHPIYNSNSKLPKDSELSPKIKKKNVQPNIFLFKAEEDEKQKRSKLSIKNQKVLNEQQYLSKNQSFSSSLSSFSDDSSTQEKYFSNENNPRIIIQTPPPIPHSKMKNLNQKSVSPIQNSEKEKHLNYDMNNNSKEDKIKSNFMNSIHNPPKMHLKSIQETEFNEICNSDSQEKYLPLPSPSITKSSQFFPTPRNLGSINKQSLNIIKQQQGTLQINVEHKSLQLNQPPILGIIANKIKGKQQNKKTDVVKQAVNSESNLTPKQKNNQKPANEKAEKKAQLLQSPLDQGQHRQSGNELEINKRENQRLENKLVSSQGKQLEDDQDKEYGEDDMLINFEKSKHFTSYFPHNNLKNVLESFNRYYLKKYLQFRQKGANNPQLKLFPMLGASKHISHLANIFKKRVVQKPPQDK